MRMQLAIVYLQRRSKRKILKWLYGIFAHLSLIYKCRKEIKFEQSNIFATQTDITYIPN